MLGDRRERYQELGRLLLPQILLGIFSVFCFEALEILLLFPISWRFIISHLFLSPWTSNGLLQQHDVQSHIIIDERSCSDLFQGEEATWRRLRAQYAECSYRLWLRNAR